MRKILVALAALLLALLAVVTVRTMRFTPHGGAQPSGVLPATNDSLLAEHLAGAVRIPTISFQDSAPPHVALQNLHAYLARTFPLTHTRLTLEEVGGDNLLFEWKGSDTTLGAIVIMGHMDVVPMEPGTEGAWTHPAFSGDIADGFVWGRGTLDDKVGVLSALEAVEALLANGVQPRRTVYLAFGADEEVVGRGARDIIGVLKARGVRPDVAIDEGSAIVRGVIAGLSRPAALIGVSEKGYASVELTVTGTGGHSSMPPAQTAVGILADAIVELEEHQMPARLNDATAGMFDQLGRGMVLTSRMAMANLWLTKPLVLRMLAGSPTTNAAIRTTTAATVFQGSPKDNVLPVRARAIVNFRIIPGETPDDVLEHVRTVVDDARVTVAFSGTPNPPSPVSSTTSASYAVLANAIRLLEPDAIVAPSLVVGATDSRNYAGFARDVYRFLPGTLESADLARIHGINERIGVRAYGRSVAFMTKLIGDLAAK